MSPARSLAVFLGGERAGTLADQGDVWRFDYEAAWAASARGVDLAPTLPRTRLAHLDGATRRTVQWFFDNLLPEESQREAITREAQLRGDDTFGLLAYLGAESAGSLVLLPEGEAPQDAAGLRPLEPAALMARINALPRSSLSAAAPKRMSAAGAQHKLLVVYRDGLLSEPVGNEPSTHLLKPDHPGDDYPATVINEFVVMRLAQGVGLSVPPVTRLHVPAPVYLVERFDRHRGPDGRTQRLHVVDGCQALGVSRHDKYRAANLAALQALIGLCRNKAAARLHLFRWLLFNVLIGNHDNHLKNLSFFVTRGGLDLAPAYDLLSTAAYHTRAFAGERANWPAVDLAIPLNDELATFAALSRAAMVRAGVALGLPERVAEREIQRMTQRLSPALDAVLAEVDQQNAAVPQAERAHLAREQRMTAVLKSIVVRDMLERLA